MPAPASGLAAVAPWPSHPGRAQGKAALPTISTQHSAVTLVRGSQARHWAAGNGRVAAPREPARSLGSFALLRTGGWPAERTRLCPKRTPFAPTAGRSGFAGALCPESGQAGAGVGDSRSGKRAPDPPRPDPHAGQRAGLRVLLAMSPERRREATPGQSRPVGVRPRREPEAVGPVGGSAAAAGVRTPPQGSRGLQRGARLCVPRTLGAFLGSEASARPQHPGTLAVAWPQTGAGSSRGPGELPGGPGRGAAAGGAAGVVYLHSKLHVASCLQPGPCPGTQAGARPHSLPGPPGQQPRKAPGPQEASQRVSLGCCMPTCGWTEGEGPTQ